jgi:ATP phosphoribosyltransferase regulatory subunit
MSNQDKWLLPDGVDELLPARAQLAELLRRSIIDLFNGWGYQLVMPPLIEFTDSLLIGLGDDIALQSFRLTDQISGKPMAVRADITAQTARIDAHSMKAKGTNRLCYAGSVLHARPKAAGASRCPILAGAELYGEAGSEADVEIISLMLQCLRTLEVEYGNTRSNGDKAIHRLTLDLGHVAIYQAVIEAVKRSDTTISAESYAELFDAVQRKSSPDLELLVPALIKDEALAAIILSLPLLCGGIEVLARAKKLLAPLGEAVGAALDQMQEIAKVVEQRFPDVGLYFDLSELRGYEYHTGLVFAAYADGIGSALANGGRYDDVGKVFGASRPATGFNTDIKVLLDYLQASVEPATAIAAPQINDPALWSAVCALREKGHAVVSVTQSELKNYSRQLIKTAQGWKLNS